MPNLRDNKLLAKRLQISNLLDKNFESIQEFVDTANTRLDAINSITNNSHAIAADAVTAMICENEDSLNSNFLFIFTYPIIWFFHHPLKYRFSIKVLRSDKK